MNMIFLNIQLDKMAGAAMSNEDVRDWVFKKRLQTKCAIQSNLRGIVDRNMCNISMYGL